MKLSFACPACGGKLSVPIAMAGKRGRCPKCEEVISIPRRKPPSDDRDDEADDDLDDDDEDSRPTLPKRLPRRGESKRCPMCGAKNPLRAATCRECGEDFQADRPRETIPWGEPISIGDAVQTGWEVFRENAGILMGAGGIWFVVSIVMNLGQRFVTELLAEQAGRREITVEQLSLMLLFIQGAASLVRGVFTLGIANLSLQAVRGDVEFTDIVPHPLTLLKCMAVAPVYYALPFLLGAWIQYRWVKDIVSMAGQGDQVVGMALMKILQETMPLLVLFGVMIWTFALIFWSYAYLLLDEKAGLLDCLPRAFRLSVPNIHKILALWIISGLVYLGGAIVCCIGVIAAYPLGQCILAAGYVQMVKTRKRRRRNDSD